MVMLDEGAPPPRSDLPLDSFKRHLGPECRNIPIKDETGTRHCRWCGTGVRPPRLTFCGDPCVHEWKLRASGSYVRMLVHRRDRGVCAGCGLDTESLYRRLRIDWGRELREWCNTHGFSQNITVEQEILWDRHRAHVSAQSAKSLRIADPVFLAAINRDRTDLWEADHIVQVVRGGGQCGLSNYQTLCLVCHSAKTTDNVKRSRPRSAHRSGKRQVRRTLRYR